jgi:hypothetical protein
MDRVVKLMREIGPNGEITKDSYRIWPLFEGARDERRFQEAFAEIFGEELTTSPVAREILEGQVEPQQKSQELTGAFLLEFLDATELDLANEFGITVKANLEAAFGSESQSEPAPSANED